MVFLVSSFNCLFALAGANWNFCRAVTYQPVMEPFVSGKPEVRSEDMGR